MPGFNNANGILLFNGELFDLSKEDSKIKSDLKVCDDCYRGCLNGESFIGYNVKNEKTKKGYNCCNCGNPLSEFEKLSNALDS